MIKLISTLHKESGLTLKTYRTDNGRIAHVMKTPFSLKVANCDEKGNPTLLLDIVKDKVTTYIKAKDGSTMIKEGNSIKNFPNLIFNNIASLFFK